MKTEYDFIVNPKARSGMGDFVWRELSPELIKRGVDFRLYRTEKAGHAKQIAAGITADGKEHVIVVLGGDGTVNETVNGIADPEKVTLGYIPIGSSNDFARGLGISKDPKKALEAVLSPRRTVKVDVGMLTRNGRTRRFAVSAGIGFDAAVCHEVCVSRWKKILNRIGLGKMSYAVVALHRLLCDTPVKMQIRIDDGKIREYDKAYFAAFMNLRYEGGGFMFCPGAAPGDGMLDVIVVHGLSVPKVLLLLPTAFFGRHVRFKGITILRCRKAEVWTGRPLPIHTDGEPCFLRKKVEASVAGGRLTVITE